jgi:hypothetical protein
MNFEDVVENLAGPGEICAGTTRCCHTALKYGPSQIRLILAAISSQRDISSILRMLQVATHRGSECAVPDFSLPPLDEHAP